jgi:metacaspase-1
MAKEALCIGINDYPGTDNDLAGCDNDARDWAAALEARGFKVRMLLDRAATGHRMREEIAAVVGRARKGDLVVIQYSGHGSLVPDTNGDEPDGADECLCPWDIASQGPIVDDELFALYGARREGVRLFMVSDSCHSGTVTRFVPIRTPPVLPGSAAPRRTVRFLPPAAFLGRRFVERLRRLVRHRAKGDPGRHAALLLAACQDNEYSYDAWFRGRPNGAFTYVALAALRRLPGPATYRQWFERIRQALPSRQYPQSPNLFGSAGMKAWPLLA